MTEERVRQRLALAQMELMLCRCPVRAETISAEIHGLKANLYRRRKRAFKYQDNHRAFQKTGVGQ